ncbi:hypothetical protein AVEN_178347-1 [Araneus ventricosus]|uniref:Uncharacterized protein n=1 Tax=Araneus ventricosus TaxID=182803 RepID=A0A4Y2BCJ4_ARAVE|nr:hypothetical protein AVEN_178347-1 [Araneus ventricosus]
MLISSQIRWRLQSDDRLNLLSYLLRKVLNLRPARSNYNAYDTIANGKYREVWTIGTGVTTGLQAYSTSFSRRLIQFVWISAVLWQQ